MREQLASTANFTSWPEPPDPAWDDRAAHEAASDRNGHDGPERRHDAAVADITSAMADSRRISFVVGGLLTANITGAAIAVSAFLGHGHQAASWAAVLLVPVMLSWLVAAISMITGEAAIASSLGELRRVTGAPVDLSAPWISLGVRPMAKDGIDWDHVVMLIAAANRYHARARLALSWAVITTVGFFLWLVLSLVIGAVS
jgi:hypothetical protein